MSQFDFLHQEWPPVSRTAFSALVHESSFKLATGEAVFTKARVVNTLGNRAVHGHRAVPSDDARVEGRELVQALIRSHANTCIGGAPRPFLCPR